MKNTDEMPSNIDFDQLGEPVVGKYQKEYQDFKRTRGKQKTATKVAISIRLDVDVLEAFRAKGKGWQSDLNARLRESLAL